MTQDELHSLLRSLISEWEGECLEFKEANDNFPASVTQAAVWRLAST